MRQLGSLRTDMRRHVTADQTQFLPLVSFYCFVLFGIFHVFNVCNITPPPERQTHEIDANYFTSLWIIWSWQIILLFILEKTSYPAVRVDFLVFLSRTWFPAHFFIGARKLPCFSSSKTALIAQTIWKVCELMCQLFWFRSLVVTL